MHHFALDLLGKKSLPRTFDYFCKALFMMISCDWLLLKKVPFRSHMFCCRGPILLLI